LATCYGAGFIGSELERHLAALGASVRVVDNLVNGRRENLEGVLSNNVELTVADIRDRSSISSLLREADIVSHLACLGVRHSIHSPRENKEVNATAYSGPPRYCMQYRREAFRVDLDL